MKHIIFLLLLSLSFGLFAQRIISVKDNGKAPYTYAGEKLNMRALGSVLESNPEAYALYKNAKGAVVGTYVLAAGGGYLVGQHVGIALFDDQLIGFNIFILGAGVALIGTSFVIAGDANKRLAQGVERYNRDFPPAPNGPNASLNLGVTTNGVGLVFSF